MYFGTGNAGPWPADLRNARGKDNLYVCSIIALKADTGEYKWHFQLVPGDSWDYDAVQQLILADITIKGQPRKVIMQASKNGFFYVLDRITGKFISGQPYVKVSWAKGLDEATGRPIVNEDAYYSKTSAAVVQPGPNGGHNWAPMSFNPMTGLVYVPATSGTTFTYATDPDFELKPGQLNLGIVFSNPNTPRGGGRGRGAGGRSGGSRRHGGEVATAAAQAAAAPPPRQRLVRHQGAASGDRPGRSAGRHPDGLGSGDAEASLDRARRRLHRRRHRDHGGQPGDPGSLKRLAASLQRGQGRKTSGDPDQSAHRHGTAHDLYAGRQAVRDAARADRARRAADSAAAGLRPLLPKLLTFVMDGKAPLPEPVRNQDADADAKIGVMIGLPRVLACAAVLSLGAGGFARTPSPKEAPLDSTAGATLASRIPCDGATNPSDQVNLLTTFSPGGLGAAFRISSFRR